MQPRLQLILRLITIILFASLISSIVAFVVDVILISSHVDVQLAGAITTATTAAVWGFLIGWRSHGLR